MRTQKMALVVTLVVSQGSFGEGRQLTEGSDDPTNARTPKRVIMVNGNKGHGKPQAHIPVKKVDLMM